MATHAEIASIHDVRPTVETLAARARMLLPAIRERQAAANAACDLPQETIAEMRQAGLLRAFQPVRWGGMELDPRDMLDLQNIFAESCLSTAWVFGVLSVQAFLLGRMGEQAQADVWAEDRDMLISSSFAPAGEVQPVEGGYLISGRYSFSSGSSHAGWAMVGGLVPPAGDRTTPQMRLFLVPRAEYRIDPVWDTIGLRGTGSNDLILETVFVPDYRTYVPDDGLCLLPASSGVPPLYRLPWLHMFTSMISNIAVGGGRGALGAFTDMTRTRRNAVSGAPSGDSPAFRSAIGRMRAELEALDIVAKQNFTTLIDHVDRDMPLPMETALVCRAALTGSLRRVASLVDELLLLLGGRGIRRDSPLMAYWLDFSAARAHPGNDPSAVLGQLAGEILKDGR